jgi:hypothetical protein
MALHSRFVKRVNIKSNDILIIRTHLGDMCFPTLFPFVFQTLLHNGWVVTVPPEKVESDKATLLFSVLKYLFH